MSEKPHQHLLDRNLYKVFIKDVFSDTLELLEDLVNYGSNLVPRCFESSEKKLHDVVILINFLKQGVSLLDSIHILAKEGATTSCFILLRSLFEINIYLDWIFKESTEKRGSLYFVWELRKKLYWALSVKKGTLEHDAHKKHMKDTPIGAELKGVDPEIIDAEIESLKVKLNLPECSTINKEFEKLKSRRKDREWYTLEGINNFREMAAEVGKEGTYKVLYTSYSALTHGLTLDQQVRFSDNKVIFEPIRNLTGIDEVLRSALNFAMGIYRSVLRHYRPNEEENFNKKYMTEWRDRFLSVKKVEYKNGTYVIKEQNLANKKVELTSRSWRSSK